MKRRRRRYRVNVTRLVVIFSCFAAAVVGCVALIDAMARSQSMKVVESPGKQITVKDNYTFEPIVYTSVPPVTGDEEAEPEVRVDTTYLTLINWENEHSGERPEDLKRLGDVFGDEVDLVNADGSINMTAGQAASEMFKAARAEGVGKFLVTSAYRAVGYQNELYEEWLEKNPDFSGDPYAHPVKALPGKNSEHVTGLAVDILSVEHDTADEGFADTDEAKWLMENAHKYGFILRYPEDKQHMTGVIYEPWHYRYVGREAAAEIYEQGVCLEEYLGEAHALAGQ